MNDDPQIIAEHLITDLGLKDALKAAIDGTTEANAEGDRYRLSIWRDVKRILKKIAA